MSYYDDASLVLIPSGIKAAKVYSQKPTGGTGDFTFGRASTATRTNASGVIESVASNVPRLDYMTATGALATCPMLEAEQQRTNLLLQSEAFNNAYWEKGSAATVTANTVISPDGTQNADTLTANGSGEIFVRKNIYSGTAQTCNNSVFVKKANNRYVGLRNTGNPSGAHDVFDFDTKTWTNNSGATLSYDELGNGWFRLKSTNTEPVRLNYYWSVIPALNTSGAETGTASNLSVYIWGAQAEQNVSFPSTYIPTTTASVTRLKDDISISGASALIGQTEGTIFLDVDFRVVSSGGIRVFLSLEGSVANQFSGIIIGTSNNANDVNFAGSYALTQGRHKIVCRYNSATNQSKLFVDGAQRAASTFAAFAATIDRISVLGRINPFNAFAVDRQQFGGCNQFVVWKTALSDAQCIELSTL